VLFVNYATSCWIDTQESLSYDLGDKMTREIKIGDRLVGDGHPAYIVAEIGINHNGDLEMAKEMIKAAHHAGVDAVKFQKRTPELCVPPEQRGQMRETPWGYITYLDYRYRVEFGEKNIQRSTVSARNWALPGLRPYGMSPR